MIWAAYCDWYVELAKPLLTAEDESLRRETRATAGWCMARLLQRKRGGAGERFEG